ncbi:hypothetical protein GCM10010140_66930 [Streptosporangium pseudovulgare]|uniref:Uncharacterized protein n=2 Tax=Streptosporangium pseudovulgare TaxID=35765 RepID=A0ABQ2RET1_9ACTN|nr:hypothetical protein GCM10010140_66930 [Streptosporangium pseudovulgare]
MRGEHTSLWRTGLRGFLAGAIGGFPVGALVLWLHENGLWPPSTISDWQDVNATALMLGWINCLSAIFTEYRRRNRLSVRPPVREPRAPDG